jgi:hypothetical protein
LSNITPIPEISDKSAAHKGAGKNPTNLFTIQTVRLRKMNSKYLATDKATDWKEDSSSLKVLKRIFKNLNPNYTYEDKFPFVRKWLIEFDDGELPGREIGLDEQGNPLFCGPSDEVYGFWLDTNMAYDDFEGEPITKEEFEKYWGLATSRN